MINLTSQVTQLQTTVNGLQDALTTVGYNVLSNGSAIASNTSAIAGVQTAVETNENAISGLQAGVTANGPNSPNAYIINAAGGLTIDTTNMTTSTLATATAIIAKIIRNLNGPASITSSANKP